MFHFPLTFVARRVEDLAVILRRQVRRQQTNRGQGDRPVGQQRQDDRKLPRNASGLDASIGGVLGEAEDLRAVGEERRAALPEIEPPRVQFREPCAISISLTNAFSKKLASHEAAVALHFMHYNFCRVHQTLRVTSAKEAGISSYVWSIVEIVGLLDAADKNPRKM